MIYGSSATIGFDYDLFDRIILQTYYDGESYHYVYNNEGALAKQYATNAADAATI